MKRNTRMLSRAGLALAAIIIGLGLQVPLARADCTDNCTLLTLPGGPKSVMDRSWEAQGLARFLKSKVLIEYRDRAGRPIKIIPHEHLAAFATINCGQNRVLGLAGHRSHS